jgi:hypothetical protein
MCVRMHCETRETLAEASVTAASAMTDALTEPGPPACATCVASGLVEIDIIWNRWKVKR